MASPLGDGIPANDQHAVSVSLPLWEHMVGWGKKDEKVVSAMKAGYPRFFVPLIVRHLAQQLVDYAAPLHLLGGVTKQRSALIFPHVAMAELCLRYLQGKAPLEKVSVLSVSLQQGIRPVEFGRSAATSSCLHDEVYLVAFPEPLGKDAKTFWMHTGFGISTRCASFWLDRLPMVTKEGNGTTNGVVDLPHRDANAAKDRIRERIAGAASSATLAIQVQDVFLYHTGMSAIFHSGQLIQACSRDTRRPPNIAVFGFLYVDTVKVLERVLGCPINLYGHGSSADLDKLEADLRNSLQVDALYLEFPGNPLLRSPDLRRIWTLSKEFGFVVVLDDTVSTTANLNTMPCCDIAVTSLTKMFSGACNVMGGSLTLNPQSQYYNKFHQMLRDTYVDTYFPPDAIVMGKNCVDFEERVQIASRNAEHISDLLKSQPQVAEVFYPKGSASQCFYDEFKRDRAGYGYLLSIRFTNAHAAQAFYDALDVAKGPSLGTNFSLSCAYTWLAHATELDWAAEYGVVEDLVRISFGIEELDELERIVRGALKASV